GAAGTASVSRAKADSSGLGVAPESHKYRSVFEGRVANSSFAPSGLVLLSATLPRAGALGCILPPLRGSGTDFRCEDSRGRPRTVSRDASEIVRESSEEQVAGKNARATRN